MYRLYKFTIWKWKTVVCNGIHHLTFVHSTQKAEARTNTYMTYPYSSTLNVTPVIFYYVEHSQASLILHVTLLIWYKNLLQS